jgi:hypothetical protein
MQLLAKYSLFQVAIRQFGQANNENFEQLIRLILI